MASDTLVKPSTPLPSTKSAESEASLSTEAGVDRIEAVVVDVDDQTLRLVNVVDARLVMVADMTETHAKALVEVEEKKALATFNQYAVPAQEETKRGRQQTVQRFGLYGVVSAALVIAMLKLSGGELAWALIGIMTVLGAREVLPDVLKKKPPALPPAGLLLA